MGFRNAWIEEAEKVDRLEKENIGLRKLIDELEDETADLKLKNKVNEYKRRYPEYFN